MKPLGVLGKRLLVGLCFVTSFSSLACGSTKQKVTVYQPSSLEKVRCLYLTNFKNLSGYVGAEQAIGQLLEQAILQNTKVRLTADRQNADALITGSVKRYGYHDPNDYGEQVPLLVYELLVVDRTTEQPIWSCAFDSRHTSQTIGARNRNSLSKQALEAVESSVAQLTSQIPNVSSVDSPHKGLWNVAMITQLATVVTAFAFVAIAFFCQGGLKFLDSSLSSTCFAATTLLMLVALVKRADKRHITNISDTWKIDSRALIWLLSGLFLISFIITLPSTPTFVTAFSRSMFLIAIWFLTLTLYGALNKQAQTPTLFLCLVFLLFISLTSLLQRVSHFYWSSEQLANNNHIAAIIVMLMFIPLAKVMRKGHLTTAFSTNRNKSMLIAVVVFANIALLLTYSRAAFIAAAVGYLFFLYKSRHKIQARTIKKSLIILAIVTIGGIAYASRQPDKETRESFVTRLHIYETAIRSIKQADKKHMLFGYGPGSYVNRYLATTDANTTTVRPKHAHSMYLQLLIEHGIIGMVLFALICFLLIPRIFNSTSSLQLGAATGLLSLLVHEVFEANLHLPTHCMLAVLLLAICLSRPRAANEMRTHYLPNTNRLKGISIILKYMMIGVLIHTLHGFLYQQLTRTSSSSPSGAIHAVFVSPQFEKQTITSWRKQQLYSDLLTISAAKYQLEQNIVNAEYLAYVCDILGLNEQANHYVSEALRLDSGNANIWFLQGKFQLNQHLLSEALISFERALSLNSQLIVPVLNTVEPFSTNPVQLSTLIDKHQKNASVQDTWISFLSKKGYDNLAVEAAERAADQIPGKRQHFMTRQFRLYIGQNKIEEAENVLTTITPKNTAI